MKVVVVRSDDNFCMILEYLHYHMDIIYERQLVKIESNTYSPRFMISCPNFEYNEIKFAITQQENYKSVYENYYKYS